MAGLIAAVLATLALAHPPALQPAAVGGGARTIAGRVVTISEPLARAYSIHVHRPGPDGEVATTLAPIAPDGRFAVTSLEPGVYILEAAPGDAGHQAVPADASRGFTVVRVGRDDVTDVTISLVRPATVRGRIRLDGQAQAPSGPTQVQVLAPLALTEWTATTGSVHAAADGTFLLPLAGPRLLRVNWGPGGDGTQWWFESVQWNGRDITNEPVDFSREPAGDVALVFTRRPTAIVGTLEDVAGIPMAGACVVMLPDNPDLQRSWSTAVGTATTDRRGRFYFTSMPPGEYRLEGVSRACPDRAALLADADVFMRRATAVTVVAQRVARIVVTGETSGSRP